MTREAELSRTFVEMADTLTRDFDVFDFLHTLSDRCVELLDVDAAGLMLAGSDGRLRVLASSDEQVHLLELFEVQNEEGPCLDCFRSGSPVRRSASSEPSVGRASAPGRSTWASAR